MTVRLNAFARRIAWLGCVCIIVVPFQSSSWSCAAANATNASDVAGAEAARVYDTPMDQALWLDRHNWFRSEGLLWEAANMRRIQWEFALAEEARAAIASCEKAPSESPGLHVYIESTPDLPLDVTLMDRAMQSWGFDELYGVIPTLPIPGKGATGSHSEVGVGVYNHYSQLVWSSTSRVGCAYNICGEGRLAACKYAPVGNTPGVAWYEFGEPCSHCDAAEAAACSQNLCVASNSSTGSNSVDAKDSSSTVHLPQKVKALQIALDSYVVHPGNAAATTSVSALSTEATSGLACNSSTPASNVVTQEQLSLLDLGGGVSPLAVIFGLFLGVGAILVMIVCIMHATKPKRRHSGDQHDSGDEQEEQESSESDQEGGHVQMESQVTATSHPKRTTHRGGRHSRRRSAKQQDDEDDDSYEDDDEDGDEDHEHKQRRGRRRNDEDEQKTGGDWDEQEEKEGLIELRQNIALLLQGIKTEASALDLEHDQADEDGDDDNCNQ